MSTPFRWPAGTSALDAGRGRDRLAVVVHADGDVLGGVTAGLPGGPDDVERAAPGAQQVRPGPSATRSTRWRTGPAARSTERRGLSPS